MPRYHRRRKKKGGIITKRVSPFIQTYDPEHFLSIGVAFIAVSFPIVWWVEDWDKAMYLGKFVFFFCLSISAGANFCAVVYDAFKGAFRQKEVILAVIKSVVIAIAITSIDDHVAISKAATVFGFGLFILVFCLTIISKVVLSWLRK